jgi:hypothetical protein
VAGVGRVMRRSPMRGALPALVLALLQPADVRAQTPACREQAAAAPVMLNDARDDFQRLAELAGVLPSLPRLARRVSETGGRTACAPASALPWQAPAPAVVAGRVRLEMVPPTLRAELNSAYPRNVNNGALWAGRGVSAALSGGVRVAAGPVSGALAPALVWQQNAAFEVAASSLEERSPWVHAYHGAWVDLPQRFGDGAFHRLDPGQSHIRLDVGPVAAGASTENLWWGPALRYPLIMGSTAPGFPHVHAGTSRARGVGIGRLEAQLVWGRLRESPYFDFDPDNDERFLAGVAAGFEPRWLPNLFVGGSRVFMQRFVPGAQSLGDYVLGPYRGVRANPLDDELGDNQLLSLFARWAHPAAGLEVYFEWGREDHWADLDELVAVPDASQAVTLGMQKVFAGAGRWVRVAAEATRLNDALPYGAGFRSGPLTWYTHGQVIQGHTHRGQLLGAWVGPGADAQFLAIDVFSPGGRTGGFLERVRRDADIYRMRWSRDFGPAGHDVELTAGVRQLRFIRGFDLEWGASYSHRSNRAFLGMYDSPPRRRVEHNIGAHVQLGWNPRGATR